MCTSNGVDKLFEERELCTVSDDSELGVSMASNAQVSSSFYLEGHNYEKDRYKNNNTLR